MIKHNRCRPADVNQSEWQQNDQSYGHDQSKGHKTTNQKNMEITNKNDMKVLLFKVTSQKDRTIQTKRRANQVIKLQRETHSQLLY